MGRPCCRSLLSAECPMNAGQMRLAVSAVEQYGGGMAPGGVAYSIYGV